MPSLHSTVAARYPPIDYAGLALVFSAPALGGFLYGFDIGATSFALAMKGWDISEVQQGLFVSGASLGALLGSHLLFAWLDHLGRRTELRSAAALYAVGAAVVGHGPSFGWIIAGRLLFGAGVGFTMHGAPAYMAEMCPPQIRGAMVSAKETIIVGGIVVGYAVGNCLSARNGARWTDLYTCSFFIALPMLVLTCCIPRSKRWLLLHGHVEEAYQSMQFVYKGDIREAFEHLVSTVQPGEKTNTSNPTSLKQTKVVPDDYGSSDSDYDSCDEEIKSGTTYDSIHSLTISPVEQVEKRPPAPAPSVLGPRYRSAMIASMGLITFQQFSGQPSILSYATVLFGAAGWSGNASVVTAVLMMMASTATVLLVERLGRKRMLSACCIIMMSALAALSSTYWGWTEDDPDFEFSPSQKMTMLVAMFVYIGGYQVGFGPITWCLVSETFPLEIRSKAIALGVELNYLLNFAVQFAFPILKHYLGWGRTFAMFGMILACALVHIRVFVPETSGLTLEEIERLLRRDEPGFLTASEEAPLLRATPNIDEMESQLTRRRSNDAA